MSLKINGKEINQPVAKALVLTGVAIIIVILAIIVIPVLGIALGLLLISLAIVVPFLGWKKIVGKVTSKINIYGQDRGYIKIESNLFESMSTNKKLKIMSEESDVTFNGTDNYNKLSIECDAISYFETHDKIQVYVESDAQVTLPSSVAISALTGAGDILGTNIQSMDVTTGSGDIKITDLQKSIKGATGAGDFKIAFSEKATRGTVKLATTSGDAQIVLPKNASVTYQSASISGITECEFSQNDNASFKIKFAAASGDLSIEKSK